MKVSVVALTTLAALGASSAEAKNVHAQFKLPKPDSAKDEAKVVKMDVTGHRAATHPNPRVAARFAPKRLHQRDSTVEMKLSNEDYSYYSTEIEIGNPSQKVGVLVDTGSSDLWVIDKENPYCTKDEEEILLGNGIECLGGTFSHKDSKSFHKNNSDFSTAYADGSAAEGLWGTDDIKVAGKTLKDASFAVGLKANSTVGVLGVGFDTIESTNVGEDGYTYMNIPQLYKSEGLINKVAYSLWLNNKESSEGSLLFGGVDHKKYDGDLTIVPMAQTIRGFDRAIETAVYLSEIKLSNGDGDDDKIFESNIPALLDSGTTMSYLPSKLISAIGKAMKADYEYQLQTYSVACKGSPKDAALEFNFNGAVIKVPLNDMTIPLQDTRGKPAKFSDGSDACALAMQPADDVIVLGDSFLRSAYVVYDLENREIALANAKHDEDDSDVEEIKSDIPSAKSASNYSNTTPATTATYNTPSFEIEQSAGGKMTASDEKISHRSPVTATGQSSRHAASSSGSSSSTSSSSSSGSSSLATASSTPSGSSSSSGDSDGDSSSGSSIAAPLAGCVVVFLSFVVALM